ncbi:hypothetical protein CNR22_17530 [Sphingobacteriaceae bacterium]|nr:hypothetical protein CNR22_17530 [Sphingobacteriaceae bacterium]
MKNIKEFLESGILELYILGLTSEEENLSIRKWATSYPEIHEELDAITEALLTVAQEKVPAPKSDVKALLMGTIDYTERLTLGEAPAFPPELSEKSTAEDFSEWLMRKDLDLSESTEDIELKIIGHEVSKMTAIVRLVTSTPYEIHDKEIEKFLILEGSCDIVTDQKTYSLVAGDYYAVPLNLGHIVKVTSDKPCLIILQRVAA